MNVNTYSKHSTGWETVARRVPKAALIGSSILMLFSSHSLWARGEITEIQTHTEKATPSSYVENGATYQWGLGSDLIIDGFTYQGTQYQYGMLADRVEVIRVDNENATGESCGVFAETAGQALSYTGSYPDRSESTAACDIGKIISGNTLNVGALDVFSNAGNRMRSHKNIERVDLIVSDGIAAAQTTAELEKAGHVLLEKSGNNPVKIAAITSLNAAGEPAGYAQLVTVHPATAPASELRYGITSANFNLNFLGTLQAQHDRPLTYANSLNESLGMVLVSQADMGLQAGQNYYGFSVFPSDVDAEIHSLLQPETFPADSSDTETSGPGDADFFAAFAIPVPPVNTAPVANDDFITTDINTSVDIDVLANDLDADGDPLTIELVSSTSNGTLNIQGNIVSYSPDPDFSGSDRFIYQINDGKGGSSTANVVISVTAVKSSGPTAIIQTGLVGHGAGSFDWWLMLSLIPGIAFRLRSRKST